MAEHIRDIVHGQHATAHGFVRKVQEENRTLTTPQHHAEAVAVKVVRNACLTVESLVSIRPGTLCA